MNITWVLERDVFADAHGRLAEAASSAGHGVVSWDDVWWENGNWPSLNDHYAIFHGSLGNASRIVVELPWKPGSFCNTSAFACSAWYGEAKAWLLHRKWVVCSAKAFVSDAESYLKQIGSSRSFFVRPDSPLKPFSGRVLQLEDLSLQALDYGFYFDDENLPIVVTPVAAVGVEWRFVVCGQKPIAASSYEATDRSEAESDCPSEAWQFAEEVADHLAPPDPVYVLDVCQCEDGLRLLELNPFSGADLYACDRAAIVAAIENVNLGQPPLAAGRGEPRR